jgi:hypothetical protein
MKISNSKKQLAEIIHENGGWRDGFNFAAQDGDDYAVWFYGTRPVKGSGRWWKSTGRCTHEIEGVGRIANWHQTILSHEEYLHLHKPAPAEKLSPEAVMGAKAALMGESIEDCVRKPTIDQLAADYRNAKDHAERLQQEADAAKANAQDARAVYVVAAGGAVGLVLSVEAPAPAPAPARKYTGEFYNAKLGAQPHYRKGLGGELCDGCGRRFGVHIGVKCPEAPDA